MPVLITHNADKKYVEVELDGQLQKSDFEFWAPKMEELICAHRPIRMLIRAEKFQGWTMGGLWEDLKFDIKHYNDVERIAIVGGKSWQKALATICHPFTTADVKYFEKDELEPAVVWLTHRKPELASTS